MCKKNSCFADLNHLSSEIYYIFQIYNNYYWELYFARHSSSHTIAKTIICIERLWNFFFGTERSSYLSFYQKQVFCTVWNIFKIQNQENTRHSTISVLWCMKKYRLRIEFCVAYKEDAFCWIAAGNLNCVKFYCMIFITNICSLYFFIHHRTETVEWLVFSWFWIFKKFQTVQNTCFW